MENNSETRQDETRQGPVLGTRQLLTTTTAGSGSVRNEKNEQIDLSTNGQNQGTDNRESGDSENRRVQRMQQVQIPALTGSLQKLKIPTPKN